MTQANLANIVEEVTSLDNFDFQIIPQTPPPIPQTVLTQPNEELKQRGLEILSEHTKETHPELEELIVRPFFKEGALTQVAVGGEAVIYSGRTQFGTPVVLRVVRRDKLGSTYNIEHAKYEHRTHKELNDTGIVPRVIAQAANETETEILSAQLMEAIIQTNQFGGYSLAKNWDETTTTTTNNLQIYRQTLEQVAKLHEQGVRHGDLKKSNVFITDNGVKLGDLGGAVNLNDLTHSDRAAKIMSAGYLSPEQLQHKVDLRTDIYALGILLYEILTEKDSPQYTLADEIYSKYKNKNAAFSLELYQRLPEVREAIQEDKEITDDFKEIIIKCLQDDPSDRYQTANELLENVELACVNYELRSYISLKDNLMSPSKTAKIKAKLQATL